MIARIIGGFFSGLLVRVLALLGVYKLGKITAEKASLEEKAREYEGQIHDLETVIDIREDVRAMPDDALDSGLRGVRTRHTRPASPS